MRDILVTTICSVFAVYINKIHRIKYPIFVQCGLPKKMKLKIFATISYKNKTFIVSLFLIYAMLLNSYAGLNYTEIKINKKKLTTTITPSIAAAADELFLGEQTVITFEGFDGDPLHTFTYTLNGGSEQTISTTGIENTVSLNTSITSLGTSCITR